MSQAIGATRLAHARVWQHFDARGQILGRIAVKIAETLMGKHKPVYLPGSDCGDYVVVTNAQHLAISGRKSTHKLYRYHTGYPGGLVTQTFDELHAKDPTAALQKAVSGMLPKNELRGKRMDRLRVFAEDAPEGLKTNVVRDFEEEGRERARRMYEEAGMEVPRKWASAVKMVAR